MEKLRGEIPVVIAMWIYFEQTETLPREAVEGGMEASRAYSAVKLWRGESVRSPETATLKYLYLAFSCIDAAYLAVETLSTGALPIAVLTQAVALSVLYYIERWQLVSKTNSP